ncbi:7339_t:CDS:2 [Paraglomus brasilianum]|uniref:7339_t:CDS:1 n=1 Tax=Paraglomus brasilianum TaxID=144538 RepID=A0A9N9AWQ1_9GLOM|nr:7339_t:CDS:2 [Paraglomus brasilianum]
MSYIVLLDAASKYQSRSAVVDYANQTAGLDTRSTTAEGLCGEPPDGIELLDAVFPLHNNKKVVIFRTTASSE